jgi:hypothetical protein
MHQFKNKLNLYKNMQSQDYIFKDVIKGNASVRENEEGARKARKIIRPLSNLIPN